MSLQSDDLKKNIAQPRPRYELRTRKHPVPNLPQQSKSLNSFEVDSILDNGDVEGCASSEKSFDKFESSDDSYSTSSESSDCPISQKIKDVEELNQKICNLKKKLDALLRRAVDLEAEIKNSREIKTKCPWDSSKNQAYCLLM